MGSNYTDIENSVHADHVSVMSEYILLFAMGMIISRRLSSAAYGKFPQRALPGKHTC